MPKRPIKGNKISGNYAQHAYQMIKDGIMKGDHPLGSELSRRNLAAQFGMSILPVSDALQKLEAEGLVESQARVGTRVRVPTPQDIRGSYIVREALECQSARLFAERATQEQRREMAERAAELDANWAGLSASGTISADRLLQLRKTHMQFHLDLAIATGYPALSHAIEKNHVLAFVTLYDALLGDPSEPSHWHETLMSVLVQRDPEKAEAVMRTHVRLGLELLLERLEPYLRWDETKLPLLHGANARKRVSVSA
jgi:DNA-binding GntR family transcriptional regulator